MKRAEKVARIIATLDQLYPMAPIPLSHRDPFTLLVAVMLSAQTTDRKVNEVTPRLFARAGTAEQMARLPVATIRSIIREVGLAPTKARHIRATSRLLVDRHGGRVPEALEELESLPGVGHKTAQVVVAQAFGQPAFPVDTHIHRLAERWGLSDGSSVRRTEADLKALFPQSRWNRLHLQIIHFGRERCPSRGHDLGACLICSWAATKARVRAESSARRAPTGGRVPRGARGQGASHRGRPR